MKPSAIAVVAAIQLLATSPLLAQRREPPPFDGPVGALAFSMSDGEPISYFLEWRTELKLTDEQVESLIGIRRKLRQENAPFMTRLDSLRRAAGVTFEERPNLNAEDRAALRRFQELSAPVRDSVRLLNEAARSEALRLLTERQRTVSDSIAKTRRAPRRPRGRP